MIWRGAQQTRDMDMDGYEYSKMKKLIEIGNEDGGMGRYMREGRGWDGYDGIAGRPR